MGPDEATLAAAASELRRNLRIALTVIAASLALVVVGVALLDRLPGQAGWYVAGAGVVFAGLYGVAGWRSFGASRALHGLRAQRVRAVGWCRPNDGCNYGVFFEKTNHLPDAVVRLPLRRPMRTVEEAWLYGEIAPSVGRTVVLVAEGGLLAAGRVLSRDRADRVWSRRTVEPGWWVQRPPDDWFPPGG